LTGQRFGTQLLLERGIGGVSLEHMVGPLRARGAHIAARAEADQVMCPPLAIAPLVASEQLRGITCELPQPDPAAKSAILISGLFATGPTTVSEPLLSPDHTERMLSALGVPLRRIGSMSGFEPEQWDGRLAAWQSVQLPGDITLAAFVAAAASAIEGSRVALRQVGWNPTRTGAFDGLRLLGSRLLVIAKGDRAGNEPVAELQVRATHARGGALGGELVFRSGESLPALCLLGARSQHGLELMDGDAYAASGDLAWPRLAELICAFGARASVLGAGLAIAPAARLAGTSIDVRADRRLCWPAVLFGLAAEGETLVDNVGAWVDDWPDAIECLRELGARIEVEVSG
jgi:3-phosphoshikimate 1-carboxyvinyltransferase